MKLVNNEDSFFYGSFKLDRDDCLKCILFDDCSAATLEEGFCDFFELNNE